MGNVFTIQFSPDNALSHCLGCIARHTNYAWELRENVAILQNDWEELKGRRNDIKEMIKVEERDPHMKVRQEVAVWLSEGDEIEAEVEELIADGKRQSVNKCLGNCCSKSCTTNYKLGKKVAEKKHKVASLKRQKKFKDVTQRLSLPRADERPAELTLGLKSTFDEVCSSLEDEQVLVKFENDLRKARNEGHHYINTLIHASLLEEYSPEKVKMHDVIRGMAIWTTKNKFFVQAGVGFSETTDVADWEGAERLSLMNNKIKNLIGIPDCPNLITLFLNHNNDYIYPGEKNYEFSFCFFRSMCKLRVLDLSENWYLRGLPEEICELVSLQYLNLSNNTKLRRLPNRLHNLINLKCLKLAYTGIDEIPEGLLSSFKKLKILKLIQYSSPVSYLPKTFVEELESLNYFNDLAITITGHFEFSEFSSSHKLTTITTSLDIDLIESIKYLDLSFMKRMKNLKSLDIIRCRELEEIIVGEEKTSLEIRNDANCFHSLRSFYISDCYKIKNLTWLTFAPKIEEIKISGCSKMKALVVGKHWEWDEVADEEEGGRPININIIPFAKLTSLSLSFLPELESIYPSALPFTCLKYLEVIDCPKLKKLPFNSSSNCKSGITTEG